MTSRKRNRDSLPGHRKQNLDLDHPAVLDLDQNLSEEKRNESRKKNKSKDKKRNSVRKKKKGRHLKERRKIRHKA